MTIINFFFVVLPIVIIYGVLISDKPIPYNIIELFIISLIIAIPAFILLNSQLFSDSEYDFKDKIKNIKLDKKKFIGYVIIPMFIISILNILNRNIDLGSLQVIVYAGTLLAICIMGYYIMMDIIHQV